VLGALICALVVLALWTLFKGSSSKKKGGNAILFVGPSDAGKTAITSSLTFHQALPTHTSLQVNETQVTFSSPTSKEQTLRIVDVPGHPRVRSQFSKYLGDAKGVVFVVDTSSVTRNGPVIAEHLHTIMHALSSLPPTAYSPPLTILAHKADLLSVPASSSRPKVATDRVRSILERELEKRRLQSISGVGVGGLGDGVEKGAETGENSVEMGGLECTGSGGFAFDRWEGGEVTIISGSVKGASDSFTNEKDNDGGSHGGSSTSTKGGLGLLTEWIEEL